MGIAKNLLRDFDRRPTHLNDKNMSDLKAYVRDKCYWDETKPETNPRCRYQKFDA